MRENPRAAIVQPAAPRPPRTGGLVFALGEIAYDLISEARRDSIQQHMAREKSNPLDPAQMLEYLRQNPWEGASIQWILGFDQTPVYAIMPAGPFAGEAYHRLLRVPGRPGGRYRRAGLDPGAAGRPGAAVQWPGPARGRARASGHV